jgi:Leucine-rich repeat (LRR) protein
MDSEEGEQLEEGIETKEPRADDAMKWYRRPYLCVLLIFFACAVVAAIAIPVALSTRRDAAKETSGNNPAVSLRTESPSVPTPTTVTPNPTVSPTWFPTSTEFPSATLTPEQIACYFLQLRSLTECRATAKIPFCGLENLNSPNMSCSFVYYERPWGARTIPSEIGLLTQLTELTLSYFQLTGTIPSTLPNLTKLTSLGMSGNKLKGTIPSSLSRLSQLRQLDLSHNLLTGSIPPSLSRLSRLNQLGFSDNVLTGTIPSSLSRLTQLWSLDVDANSLTGEVPSSLSDLTGLDSLNFAGNSLNGTILPSLCSSIAFDLLIDCDEIACDCCKDDFYGACPSGSPTSTESPSVPTPALTPEQIACNFLQLTSLAECRATARIPFCGFEYLNVRCGFGNYSPNGARTIPSEIGLLTQLTELVLSTFQLTGTIPSTLSDLTKLNFLSLIGNKLNGTIPSSLSRLSQLQQLDFSDNLLTGSIPSSLSGLTQLQFLNLNTNSLTGEVPSTLSDVTELLYLNLVANSLNGTILPGLCSIGDSSSSDSFKVLIDCGEIACDCCVDDFYGAC